MCCAWVCTDADRTNPGDWEAPLARGSVPGGSHVSQHYPKVVRLQLMMAGYTSVHIRGTGKVSSYLGRLPLLNIYGSYLATGRKH